MASAPAAAFAELDVERLRGAAAPDLDLDAARPGARSWIAAATSSGSAHPLAADGDDHVADAHAGVRRRAAGGDLARRARRRTPASSRRRGTARWIDSPRSSRGITSRDRVRRHREADPDAAALEPAGGDLRVDADHAARGVEQRAARVAGVDRRVGLDHASRSGSRPAPGCGGRCRRRCPPWWSAESPNGEPIATASWPVRTRVGVGERERVQRPGARRSTFTPRGRRSGRRRVTRAGRGLVVGELHLRRCRARPTTCALVTIVPSASTTKPVPDPPPVWIDTTRLARGGVDRGDVAGLLGADERRGRGARPAADGARRCRARRRRTRRRSTSTRGHEPAGERRRAEAAGRGGGGRRRRGARERLAERRLGLVRAGAATVGRVAVEPEEGIGHGTPSLNGRSVSSG